jgi:hypothetical protein
MFTGEQLRLVRQVKGNQTQKAVSKKLHIKQRLIINGKKANQLMKKNFNAF